MLCDYMGTMLYMYLNIVIQFDRFKIDIITGI